MVVADIIGYRTLKNDTEVNALATKIQETTGRLETGFMYFYAQRLIYTTALHFTWHSETPEEFLALEKWWDMVRSYTDEVVCYDYYIGNVTNAIANEWQDAVNDAQIIWKPPAERKIEEDSEDTSPN